MRILFVKPPFNSYVFVRAFAVCEPFEFSHLIGEVSQLAEIKVLDMRVDPRALETELLDFAPDVVCFTALTMDVNTVNRLAGACKAVLDKVIVCVGGEHATFLPEDFAADIDFVFQGDAIASFRNFIQVLSRAPAGVTPTGALPRKITPAARDSVIGAKPDRSHYAKYMDRYIFGAASPIALIQSTSGCPHPCTYCSIPNRHPKFSVQPIDEIIGEMASVPIVDLLSIDANALANIKFARELYPAIEKARIGKRIMISCRSDTIVKHPDIVPLLRRAGVSVVSMGLETFNQDRLDAYAKNNSVDNNRRAVEILRDHGILVRGNLIIEQSFDVSDFDALVDTVKELKIEFPTYQILTPLPGTKLYADMRSEIIVNDYDFFDLSHSVLPTKLDFREFHRQFQALFRRTYDLRHLLRVAKHLPIKTSVDGLVAVLKGKHGMSYTDHPGYA